MKTSQGDEIITGIRPSGIFFKVLYQYSK